MTFHARTCAADDCGVNFQARSRIAVFCSKACAKRHRYHHPTATARVCGRTECAVLYVPRDNRQRYCSAACTDRAYKDRHRRTDAGPKFTPALASAVRRGTGTYVPKPIRWIVGASPAVMAEARRELEARLARDAQTTTRGRPKGRAGVSV